MVEYSSGPNSIHFSFVGRLKDAQLLMTTLLNYTQQSKMDEFVNHA